MGALIPKTSTRMEKDSLQYIQFQAEGNRDLKILEGRTLPQVNAGAALASNARGKLSAMTEPAREHEITLSLDCDALQSESTYKGCNAGTEEETIISVVSSIDTEVRHA
jgi:hypothetical protein